MLIPNTSAQTQNFDGMASTGAATLPTGFRVSNATAYSGGTSATTLAAGTSGAGALTGTSGGGTYNFANGVTASATDRALGFLTSGSFASPRSIMLEIQNTTGSTITELNISFDYEKYRTGSRAFDWTFFSGSDGSAWTAQTGGDQSYSADGANAVVNPSTTISKNVTITGLSIAANAKYYLRWTFTGSGGSTNGQAIGIDNFSITATLAAATPTVSIAATDASAAEAGLDPGTFRISASLAPTTDLVVSYTITGTALNGTDYTTILATATILANTSSVDVTITPIDDATVEVSETVILTLTDGAAYDLGANAAATVTITNDDFTTPTFTQLGPYCVGATPDAFPTTSNNGITGTWSPTTISTTTDGTITYTFTPDAGQNATSTTMMVTVNALPAFTPAVTQPTCVNPGLISIPAITSPAGTYTYEYSTTGGAPFSAMTLNGGNYEIVLSAGTQAASTYTLRVTRTDLTPSCFSTTTSNINAVSGCTTCSALLTRNPGTLCTGDPGILNIDISAGTGNFTISIDTDGNLGTAEITDNDYQNNADILVNPSSTTTYTLISVTDNGNGNQVCTLGNPVTITVIPAPSAIISGGGNVCAPATTATVTISGTPNAVVVLSNNTMVTIEPDGSTNISLGAGTYTITTVSSAAPESCAGSGSGSVNVTVNPAPTATISGGGSVCSPATTATVTISGTPNAIVVLSDNTMVTIEGDGSTDVSLGAGTYTISSVTSAAPASCLGTSSGSATVTVLTQTPSPVFVNDANCTTANGDVCVGTKLSFSLDAIASTNLPNGSIIEWVLDLNGNNDVYDEANSAVIATQTVTKNTVSLPTGGPVINEVLFNATIETGTTNGEGWEIAGTPGTDISCFYFTDGDFIVQIPNNTFIPADGFYVVGGNAADNAWSARRDLSLGAVSGLGSLTNGGEYLAFFNAGNTFLDGVIWGSPSSGNLPSGATAISNAALIVAGSGCPALPTAAAIASSIASNVASFITLSSATTSDEQSIERSTDVTGTWQVNAAPGNTPNSLGLSNQGANTIPYTLAPACAEYIVASNDCNTTLRIRPRISPVATTCFTGDNEPTLTEKTYNVICPTASVVAASNSPVCIGADAFFNITGPANGKVTYTLGSGSVVVDLNAQGVATVTSSTANGNVTLTLQKVEQNGCATNLSASATVTTQVCCNATLATSDTEICIGEAATLTITVTNGQGNYTVSIDDGNVNTPVYTNNNYVSGTPIELFPTLTTTYTIVSVTDNGNGAQVCSTTGTPTINVLALPDAPVVSNINACAGESTKISPTGSGAAAIAATYDFENTGARRAGVASGAGASNITVSDMAIGSGLNQTGNIFGGTAPTPASAFATDQWTTNTSMDPNDYLEFCIAANPGYVLDLTNFRFDARRSTSGVMKLMLALSVDGGNFSTIGGEDNVEETFGAFSRPLTMAVIGAETVCIRIYGYNSGGTTGNLRIDNVVFSGTVRPDIQYNFYSVDPALNPSATPVATGIGYDPAPAVGTTAMVWVTCINQGGCEGPATKVSVSVTDCKPTISDPCVCQNNALPVANGTYSNSGTFREVITVNGPSGQTWTVATVSGLYRNIGGTVPVDMTDVLTETSPGRYDLVGYHIDSMGYSISVTNGRGVTLSISNKCYYPDPIFTGLPKLVSPNAPAFQVTGTVANAASGTGTFSLNSTAQAGASAAPTKLTINPATLPLGLNTLSYSFDGGTAAANTLSNPGCVKTVNQTFNVANCGCQDITVTLGANCKFVLTANLISDGVCANGTVRVMDSNQSNIDTIDCAGVWTYGLFDSFGNIICWGKVTAEDKTPPKFVCADWYKGTLDCYDVDFVLNNRQTIGNVNATSSPRPAPTSTQTINNAEGVTGTGACNLVPPSLVTDNINNLGYTYFKDNCDSCGCRTNVKWSDRVVYYNCDQMKVNGGIYARIYRTWVATDCKGMSRDTVQEIPFARPSIDDFGYNGQSNGGKYDYVAELSSCVPDKELIQKSDYMPFVCSYFNRTVAPRNSRCLYLDEVECNYSVSFKDTEFPICGGKGLKIDRELYVFDWCAGGIVDTFHILIKIGDFAAPTVEYARGAPFDISTGPMDCTAAFPISVAGIKAAFGVDIKDNCNLGNISVKLKTKDRYVKGILVAENTWEQVNYAVMNGMLVGVPVGRHRLIIDAFDGCYNSKKDSFEFEVKDKIAPVMKCDDDLHITLSNANGYTNGYAQVSAEDIDEGSWDNCKLAYIAVRRNVPTSCAASFIAKGYDTNNNGKLDPAVGKDLNSDGDYNDAGESLDNDPDGFDRNGDGDLADFGETFILKGGKLMTPLQDIVEFFCCDLAERVTIELWGEDVYGNRNFCWDDVLIEDKVAPTCVAPWNVTIYCDDKGLEKIDDRAASSALWGDVTVSSGADCAALDIVYSTVKKLKCGAGYIDRIWTLTKQTVKGPISITCTQRINILPVHEYNICFPKDVSTDCKTPIIDTVITTELGCDILAVNVHDKRYDASDDECYKIFRTYSVINWCTYDDRCGDPLLQTNISIINRAVFDNYGKAPIYLLVRDNDRDQDEEFYVSENLTPNEKADIHILGDPDRNGSASGNGYVSTVDPGAMPYCGVAQEYYHSFIYTQIIKVYDETRPVVTGIRDTFCTSPTACTANITKVVTLKDNCTDKVELETQFLMIAPFQTLEAGKMIMYSTPRWSTKDLGKGQFEIKVANLPEGTHDLIVVGRDECGNLSVPTRIPFVVKDCKAPAPICINGLSTELMPDGAGGGMMAVWASDFVASKIYDCNGQGPETKDGLKLVTKYSINRVGQPAVSTQTGLNLTCNDKGKAILVELHAWDEVGNHDFCVTYIEVQDNRSVCPGSVTEGLTIAGTIATEGAGSLQGVSVTLSGSGTQNDLTKADGNYEFVNISKGGDFTVTPQLDKNHLNGVSTFDLVLIQKHILGVQALNSPYKMIAADANNSKSISTLDLIQIRKLILNIDTHFANNTSWRFVDATYRFPSATNPWSASFPEVVSVNDLVGNIKANFVAIKIGDVNASASVNGAASAEIRTNGQFKLKTTEQNLKSGNEYKVTFTTEDLQNTQGYQFALNLDQSKVELLDIEYGVAKAENFGVFKNEGLITTSWNSKYEPGALFTLVLRAKADAQLSSALSLNRTVSPEAYDQNSDYLGIALNYEGISAAEAYELKQNTPNPFSNETVIGFTLPKATKGTLTVRDVKGALVYKVEGNYTKGNNQVILKKEQLGASGVLYYTLETNDFTATKKMIILQ